MIAVDVLLVATSGLKADVLYQLKQFQAFASLLT
jgi:hypothetical protein